MKEAYLKIRNLTKEFLSEYQEEKVIAVKDFNIEIDKGEFVTLLGPSGCGKSTFLRCLNRLIDLTDGAAVSGAITIDGVNVLDNNIDVTEIRHKIGLLPQRPNSLPMSIYDNVAYGPRIHGNNNKKELINIVEKYLTVAGLWDETKDRLKAPATTLSIGQQQRLCLARALAVEPEILLCDEPTSALDPASTEHIEQQLLQLRENYTVVAVTHNLRQAQILADYVIHLYYGELVDCGPADDALLLSRASNI